MWIGILGLSMLAIGWSFEALKVLKEKKTELGIPFAVIYTLGSIFLVIYSYQIKDIIFMLLNAIVSLLSLINLYYAFKTKFSLSKKNK